MRSRLAIGGLLAVAVLALAPAPAAAAEDWSISSFDADIGINPDSTLSITETIIVNFSSPHHGIYRDIPVEIPYDATQDRVYDIQVAGVTDSGGRAWTYSSSRNGGYLELKIGDPNRTLTGIQLYRIRYRVAGALTPRPGDDLLVWNVNGDQWPVAPGTVTAVVRPPGPAVLSAACFEGPAGSTDSCRHDDTPAQVNYRTTRRLGLGEQLSVQVNLKKGAVAVPPVKLVRHAKSAEELMALSPGSLAAAAVTLLLGLLLLGYNWWAHGRDRQYRTNHYLTNDPAEGVQPLFGHQPVTVEFEPPDGLLAPQLGVILDSRPDKKDVTACIVDLAVRGYIAIAEIPKHGLLGHRDWRIDRRKPADDRLQPFEKTVMSGLFTGGDTVLLSDLKDHFYVSLQKAEKDLLDDAMARKWFRVRPQLAHGLWLALSVALVGLGVGLVFLLGNLAGYGLVGVAVAVVGFAALVSTPFTSVRTAAGSEALRRALGFRMYLLTAERYQQQLAEKEGLFSTFLPYAIVFGCVHKWVQAFRGIDVQPSASTWYYGPGPFDAALFSSSLEGFSSSLGSAISSSPGGGGSGGFAGGGGGGGGGGAW